MSDKPQYLLAAEREATRLGSTPRKILEPDRSRALALRYPTPECLSPDDLAMARDRMEDLVDLYHDHLQTCRPCASLLQIAYPDRDDFQQVLRRAGLERSAPSATGEVAKDRSSPGYQQPATASG